VPSVWLADFPEPDRAEGLPHPRETPRLLGHAGAEAAFRDAFASGRMHHAWLIAGPRGVGKATLAWRLARFLLAAPDGSADAAGGGLFGAPPPPASLDLAPDHPVWRRTLALSEPRLFLLRRGLTETEKAVSQVISVEGVRAMKAHFTMAAADGGRRVAIVDAADEMNDAAQNALLKLLEEPPAGVTLLLVCHRPAALLPTIRSRCRVLRLAPLGPGDLAAALAQAGLAVDDPAGLAALAGGSVGEAARLVQAGGFDAYGRIVRLAAGLPRLDRPAALALAAQATGKGGPAAFDMILDLIELFLARAARTGATGAPPPAAVPDEAAVLARLAPDAAAGRAWADLAQGLGARARQGRAVNLDPSGLLLDMVLKIEATARTLAPR
jgi:DNA polymerase-3 subunit delta'